MTDALPFQRWFAHVQSGREPAVSEFVRHFEPILLKTIAGRINASKLGHLLDAQDILQSVLSQFFARAAESSIAVESAERLRAFMVVMSCNKVNDEIRLHRAGRRDYRRQKASGFGDLDQIAAQEPSPSKIASGHELVQEILGRFSTEERDLVDQRSQGRDWASIASERGGSPTVLRKKLSRAVARVIAELGLAWPSHPPRRLASSAR